MEVFHKDIYYELFKLIPFEQLLSLTVVCQKWNNLININKKEYFFASDFDIFVDNLIINNKAYKWDENGVYYFNDLYRMTAKHNGNNIDIITNNKRPYGNFRIIRCDYKYYFYSDDDIYLINFDNITSVATILGRFIHTSEGCGSDWVVSNDFAYIEKSGMSITYNGYGVKKRLDFKEEPLSAHEINGNVFVQTKDKISVYDLFNNCFISCLDVEGVKYFSMTNDFVLCVCDKKIILEGDSYLPEELKFTQ